MLSSMALAQDINFTASVNKKRLNIDDQLQLTLTVSGSQNVRNPELPSLDNFEILSQGSSSQFSVINGKMSVSKSFHYTLMPLAEGIFTINPATIEIEGKTYSTDLLTIEVFPSGKVATPQPKKTQPITFEAPSSTPSDQPETIKERIFIEVTTDKDTAYLGEQIVMTFKLYFRGVTIDNLQYTPPVTKGFLTESMGQQKEYRDIVGGVTYNVIELKTAIFPISDGILTIEPAKLKCDILVKQARQRKSQYSGMHDDFFDNFFDDSFFAPYSRHPLSLESNSVIINVKPLPKEGKPKIFKGAVGTYGLSVDVSTKKMQVGEPINITMKISGAGNIGTIPEPVIKNMEGFKAYDSEIKTNITGRGNEIAGEKIFQKMIIPQNDDIKEIPIIQFSYFDPLKNKYKIITKGPIPITVLPALEKQQEIVELIKEIAPEEESKKAVQLLAKDIQYIKTNPGRLYKQKAIWYRNLWLWLLIIVLPIILFTFSLLIKSHQIRLKEDTAYAKGRSAFKRAQQTLKGAVIFEKQNTYKEFYATLAKAIERYVSDKLNLPQGTVTIDSLSARNISNDIIEKIKSILNICDMARFGAGTFSAIEMKNAIKEVLHLIKTLEKIL